MNKFKRILFTLFIFAYMLAQFESVKAESLAVGVSEAVTVEQSYEDMGTGVHAASGSGSYEADASYLRDDLALGLASDMKNGSIKK